jgi:hypothetical protein
MTARLADDAAPAHAASASERLMLSNDVEALILMRIYGAGIVAAAWGLGAH